MDPWAIERRDQIQQNHLGEEQQIKETKRARRKKARLARQAELMQPAPGVQNPQAHSRIAVNR